MASKMLLLVSQHLVVLSNEQNFIFNWQIESKVGTKCLTTSSLEPQSAGFMQWTKSIDHGNQVTAERYSKIGVCRYTNLKLRSDRLYY